MENEQMCKICGGFHMTGECTEGEKTDKPEDKGVKSVEKPLSVDNTVAELRRKEIEQEKVDIIRRSIEDGSFCKVRNKEGNLVDSHLSREQWISVRTSAFKEWFGDWENDPENASTVRDENGEPQVVYHGTKVNFEAFDTDNKSKFKSGNYKNVGAFFTSDYNQALEYTYVKPEALKDYDNQNLPTAPDDARVLRAFLNVKNLRNFRADKSSLIGMRSLTPEKRSELKAQGYDAVRFRYDTEYVVFDANQIKSATNNKGVFDSASNNINE